MPLTTDKKVIVVMPAYMAEKTLAKTYALLPSVYHEIILCDDASTDATASLSRQLGISTLVHACNKGYGANQKTLYAKALEQNADIIIMVHPDNQYDTSCLHAMITNIANEHASLVIGSRMKTARVYGMPWWKRIGNRFLTSIENLFFRTNLSEFHSGLRAYDARLIAHMPFQTFSNNFVFDSEVIAWCIANRYCVTEVDTQCYYTPDSSSINFLKSARYGLSTLKCLLRYSAGKYNSSKQ